MAEHHTATVGAGTLAVDDGIAVEHPWTGSGVTFDAAFSGAHLLHLAVAGCVLNSVYREAQRRGTRLDGVRVTARGAFDPDSWRSHGIDYDVAVDSALDDAEVEDLIARVEQDAEIPRTLAHPTLVTRVHGG